MDTVPRYSLFIGKTKNPTGSVQKQYGHPITLEEAKQRMQGFDKVLVLANGQWVDLKTLGQEGA